MLSLLLSVHQNYNITTLQAIQACPRWWAGSGRAAGRALARRRLGRLGLLADFPDLSGGNSA
jgi:hypothetical protein